MTIATLSPGIAAQLKWDFISNTQTFGTHLAAAESQAELPGARFAATLDYRNLSQDAHRDLMADLVDLMGPAGRVYVPIDAAFPRRGAGGGTPLVNGAAQTGRTLVIDGAPLSTTAWLKKGDYISVDSGTGRELKLVTANVDTDGSGNATISFRPPIRTSPANNAAVEIDSPSALMRLVDDGQVSLTLKPARFGDMSVRFIESFPT